MALTVNLPPNAEKMINSMRALGYSFQTALADIVDNSISAQAKCIQILTSPDPEEEQFLAVLDDGQGMSREVLIESMRHASKGPEDDRLANDLGRFGLGMKTASLSQCRQLVVISKVGEEVNAVGWLMDTVIEKGDWALTIFDKSEYSELPCVNLLNGLKNGTLLIWKDFDTIQSKWGSVYDGLLDELALSAEHLSLVYHRFLTGDELDAPVNIIINGRKLEPKDPFLENRRGGADAFPDEYIYIEGFPSEPIIVTGYTLPHQNKISQSQTATLGVVGRTFGEDQGFYIYRGKRLIYWGGWLRMTRKAQASKLCRVRVDMPNSMDSIWELDIKKSKATPPKIVRDRLAEYLSLLLSKSQQIQLGRGAVSRRFSNPNFPVWVPTQIGKNQFKVRINRSSPLLIDLYQSMDDEQKKLFTAYITMLERFYPCRWVVSQFQDDRISIDCDSENSDVRSDFKELARLLSQLNDDRSDDLNVIRILKDNADTADNRSVIDAILKELK